MSRVTVLDSGPLGLVTHRGGVPEVDTCKQWLSDLTDRGTRVLVPEIADYELRRELLRYAMKNEQETSRSLERLDNLAKLFDYLPLDTPTLREFMNACLTLCSLCLLCVLCG